jgi:hypothetical protein
MGHVDGMVTGVVNAALDINWRAGPSHRFGDALNGARWSAMPSPRIFRRTR